MGLQRSALRRSSMRRSTSGGGSTPTPTVPPTFADWDPTLVRYFFLDYDGGSDSKAGYLDAAAGTVFTAGQAAAVAIKTFTKLFQIVPLLGNNRIMVVLVKPRAAGATYLDDDGVTQSVCDWSNLSGYKTILRRGSTDLTNSVADRLQCGFITALAGPNGDGSFSVLAGATSTVWSVTGTPLTAEPALTGYRTRFTGNVTAGLANVSTNITINTTSQITAGTAITVPATGDNFIIEKPGVAVAQWIDAAASPSRTISATATAPAIRDVGIMVKAATAGSLQFSGAPRTICGCEQDNTAAANVLRISDCDFASCSSSYNDETETARLVGNSIRCSATAFLFSRIRVLDADAFAHARTGGAAIVERIQAGTIFAAGSYLGSALTLRVLGLGTPGSTSLIMGSAAAATANKTRNLGGFTCASLNMAFRSIDFASASNAINFSSLGQNGGCVSFDNLTGTVTSNGLNCGAGAHGTVFLFGLTVANTVAGASNEIVTDLTTLTHATLLLTNVIDQNGNSYIGTAGRLVGACKRVVASGAIAVGDVLRGNGTSGSASGAQADTLANSTVIGIAVTTAANGQSAYMCPPGGGTPYTLFTSVPTANQIAYLSTGTIRQATGTEPVLTGVQQKVKLGRVVTVVGSHGLIAFAPDVKPENTFEVQPIGVVASNAAAAFSATQTWLIATGTYTADRAFTLEAISTLSVNARRIASDFTTAGAFNILLTPNASDSIDGLAAGVALAIPCGSKQTIEVRAMPAGGWKVM
jgi:hypothetical protein